jgi:hypothetical protein
MSNIVTSTLFGIAKDAIRLVEQTETIGITTRLVVGVETHGKKTIYAMDRLGFCLGADLKRLVIVVGDMVWHRKPSDQGLAALDRVHQPCPPSNDDLLGIP